MLALPTSYSKSVKIVFSLSSGTLEMTLSGTVLLCYGMLKSAIAFWRALSKAFAVISSVIFVPFGRFCLIHCVSFWVFVGSGGPPFGLQKSRIFVLKLSSPEPVSAT